MMLLREAAEWHYAWLEEGVEGVGESGMHRPLNPETVWKSGPSEPGPQATLHDTPRLNRSCAKQLLDPTGMCFPYWSHLGAQILIFPNLLWHCKDRQREVECSGAPGGI